MSMNDEKGDRRRHNGNRHSRNDRNSTPGSFRMSLDVLPGFVSAAMRNNKQNKNDGNDNNDDDDDNDDNHNSRTEAKDFKQIEEKIICSKGYALPL